MLVIETKGEPEDFLNSASDARPGTSIAPSKGFMKAFRSLLLGTLIISSAAFAQAVDGKDVTLTGTLRGDRIAAGGESTGWALQYKDKGGDHTVEVQLPAALATRSRTPEVVTLTGTFGTREY